MPVFDGVTIHKDDKEPRIARPRLNRPDKLNAINSTMPPDIQRAVSWAEAEDEVHGITVKGEGRAFCAGSSCAGPSRPPARHGWRPSSTRMRPCSWL